MWGNTSAIAILYDMCMYIYREVSGNEVSIAHSRVYCIRFFEIYQAGIVYVDGEPFFFSLRL